MGAQLDACPSCETSLRLQQAANYIQAIQDRQGLKVACVEEVAFRMGYIDATQLGNLANGMMKNSFGQYLLDIIE